MAGGLKNLSPGGGGPACQPSAARGAARSKRLGKAPEKLAFDIPGQLCLNNGVSNDAGPGRNGPPRCSLK